MIRHASPIYAQEEDMSSEEDDDAATFPLGVTQI